MTKYIIHLYSGDSITIECDDIFKTDNGFSFFIKKTRDENRYTNVEVAYFDRSGIEYILIYPKG